MESRSLEFGARVVGLENVVPALPVLSSRRALFPFAALFSLVSLVSACGPMLNQGEADGVETEDTQEAPDEGAQSALRTTDLIYSVDLTGDGYADKVYVRVSNAFDVDPYGSLPLKTWVKHGGDPLVAGQIAFANVGGDSKKDLIVQGYDNRFWVSISNGTGFNPVANWVSQGGGYVAGRAFYGDVDKNGMADLVFLDSYRRIWVSIATGTGFKLRQNWLSNVASIISLRDVNADGRADLTYKHVDGRTLTSLSKGTDFTDPPVVITSDAAALPIAYPGYSASCTGTLVSSRVVVTSASCMAFYYSGVNGPFVVGSGYTSDLYLHPQWQSGVDIAILVSRTTISGITPKPVAAPIIGGAARQVTLAPGAKVVAPVSLAAHSDPRELVVKSTSATCWPALGNGGAATFQVVNGVDSLVGVGNISLAAGCVTQVTDVRILAGWDWIKTQL